MDTTDTNSLIRLSIFLGVLSPWLVWLFLRWSVVAPPSEESGVARFRLSQGLRIVGLVLAIAGPSSLFVLAAQIPPENIKPSDWPIAMVLAVLMGGLASILGFEIWRMAIQVDDEDLLGYSRWGLPRRLSWHEVRDVHFSPGMQALAFRGGACTVYVPVLLDDWPGFLAAVRQAAPHLALPDAARLNGERLAYEGHFQGLYDNAGRIALIAMVVVLITLPFLSLYPPAIGLCALAGVGLAFFPLLRGFLKPPRHEEILSNILQAAGIGLSTFFLSRAFDIQQAHMGGEKHISPGEWFALFGQHFGIASLTAFSLLLAARWRWPNRFMPNWANTPD